MTLVCPACGTEAPHDARFCAQCATPLAEDAARFRPIEERRVVSVLFADLVGFTERTERSDPEDVRARLTLYHRTARELVEAHGGRVEKLLGDGVFALFGVPKAHEDDPERAVRAALGLQERIDELNKDDPDLGLEVRVAVTTGEALVQLDEDNPDRETILGDVVNTAARLQAEAPPGGVVVDERTQLATADRVAFDDLGTMDLRGKTRATGTWLATKAEPRAAVERGDRHTGPFVGRERELDALRSALAAATDASTIRAVTVIGEPGAGKSRLAYELESTLPKSVQWRLGRCLPYGEGITFWALGEIVKAEAGILESDSATDAVTKLETAVDRLITEPSSRDWVSARLALLLGGVGVDEQIDRGELFAAWQRLLEAIARREPLVIVIEDVHWADDALLDFLQQLSKSKPGAPILLVVTTRPELLTNRPDWVSDDGNAMTIELEPLSEKDAALLFTSTMSAATVSTDTRHGMLERAGGNPLYVTEFARLAAEHGSGDGPASDLPDSVQAVIAARLDLLLPDERHLAQAAAVVGEVFWSGALAEIRPGSNHHQTLDALLRRDLIKSIPEPSMRGQDEYAFSHVLVRDVAYSQIARDDRALLHEATAGWIAAVGGDRGLDVAELVAHHYGEALALTPNPDRTLKQQAYGWLMRAGERARGLDPAAGAAYYRRAVDAASDARQRADALLWAGRSEPDAHDQAYEQLDVAHAVFGDLGDREGQAQALSEMSQITWGRDERKKAFDQAQEAVDLLADRRDSEAKAHAAVLYVGRLVTRGEDDIAALALIDEVAPLVNEHGSPEDQIMLLLERASAHGALGESVAEMAALEAAMAMADDRGLMSYRLRTRRYLAWLTANRDSPKDALPIVDEAIRLAEERGLKDAGDMARFAKSIFLVDAGLWDEALALAETMLSSWAERGYRPPSNYPDVVQGHILFHRGHEDEAREIWLPYIEIARDMDEQFNISRTFAFAATLLFDAGRTDEAIALADEFDEKVVSPSLRAENVFPITGPLAELGDVDRIATLIEGGQPADLPSEIFFGLAKGHLEVACGNHAAAAELFLEAAELADRHERVHDRAIALLDAAGVLAGDERFDKVVARARRDAEFMKATKILKELDEIEAAARS